MAFEKGNKVSKGRPQGATNKMTSEIRNGIVAFLDENEGLFKERMQKLEPKEFCSFYLKMMSMVFPPLYVAPHKAFEPKSPTDWAVD